MIDPVGAKPVPSKDLLAPTIFSYLPSPLLKLNNIDKWLKFRRNNEFPIEICSIMQLYYFRFREIGTQTAALPIKGTEILEVLEIKLLEGLCSNSQSQVSNSQILSNQPQGVLFFCLCFFIKTIRLVKKFVKILNLFF